MVGASQSPSVPRVTGDSAIEQPRLRREGPENRARPKLARTQASIAGLIVATLIFASPESEAAKGGGDGSSAEGRSLLEVASKVFPRLTRAERALLEHADVNNVGRGDYAGTTGKYESYPETFGPLPEDPSNDPKDAAKWDGQRQIRASLIRWMCVDPDALPRIDPQGIKVLGAKIVGKLNLSRVKVPFAITLRRCSIPELMDLRSAEMPALDLGGSYTGPIFAPGIDSNFLILGPDFHAKGIVNLQDANLGVFGAVDGHFQWALEPDDVFQSSKIALNLFFAKIRGSVYFVNGFESRGGVELAQATIGGNLNCDSGHFINPGNIALDASSVHIGANVALASAEAQQETVKKGGYVLIDGVASFSGARISDSFFADQVRFMGSAERPHGLAAAGMVVTNAFIWGDVKLENGAHLDVSGSSVKYFLMSRNWPAPGNLMINGLTYSALGPVAGDPWDAHTYLTFLRLQPSFFPQPYHELARALRENGDEADAVRVLIAGEDERYRQYGWAGAILGGFLKKTIGYGHRPLLTVFWMLGVIVVGWAIVAVGKRAGVMRRTWPENPPASEKNNYPELHPFLYSLDVFLPFVNLHQERYFWPDGGASGDYMILGRKLGVSGSVVQYYLWLQIMSGWLLSAIFVAGVTGLIRSD